MAYRPPARYLPPRRYRYPCRSRRRGGSAGGPAWIAIGLAAALAAGAGGKAAVPAAHHGRGTASALTAAPAAPAAPGGSAALGAGIAASRGWGSGSEWTCLYDLWTRESGWSATADTRVTHAGGDGPGSPVFAYGIAEARPAEKYPLAGRPADLGGRSDAATQIRWGLDYISQVYGTPCGAWSHEESAGWY